ncbi:hypothetical protein CSC04_4346 [Enterobacter roggenkampii]|nr:hypothetical protein CSC04_4346 [Enterobacter roggenkampii]QLC81581.1 hypothetical protein ED5_0911 [Enterobacter roggenkampii]
MVIYAPESSWIVDFCSTSQFINLSEIASRFRISVSATDLAVKL